MRKKKIQSHANYLRETNPVGGGWCGAARVSLQETHRKGGERKEDLRSRIHVCLFRREVKVRRREVGGGCGGWAAGGGVWSFGGAAGDFKVGNAGTIFQQYYRIETISSCIKENSGTTRTRKIICTGEKTKRGYKRNHPISSKLDRGCVS